MKRFYKQSLLLLSVFLGIGSSFAEISVKFGDYTTLSFEINEADTNTVKLVKCENYHMNDPRSLSGDPIVTIPESVRVNGTDKAVTQIGDESNPNNSYLFEFACEMRVIFPSTTKRIAKYGFTYRNYYSGDITFDFSKTDALESINGLPKDYWGRTFMIENLTIRNGVILDSSFPYGRTRNLQYDESSTVYDLRGGCLMKKGDNETAETLLRGDFVRVPNTVKVIAHSMPLGDKRTHISFEEGSQLEEIAGSISDCVIEELPNSIKIMAYESIIDCELLSFTLPTDLSGFNLPFYKVTFNELNF